MMHYAPAEFNALVPLAALSIARHFLRSVMPGAKTAKPKKATSLQAAPTFGAALVRARKAAGLTQQELADATGISRRMVVYYEAQEGPPLAVFLSDAADALGTSVDALLGREVPQATAATPARAKFERRISALESLAPAQQRQALELLDALIERAALKQARDDESE